MYQQQGQQPFPNGPGPSHRQPPPTQHTDHPNMQRMGFQFPRPTQLPDELESALSARGARDVDHRQIDHMSQNQGPASRMNPHGSYGSNPLPPPTDNPSDLRPVVDWSNFQPPVKLFASPPPNVSCQPQQHHGQLQQPPNIQAGPRVPNWAAPVCDSLSAQTRHPSSGGEGHNLYTPESAGSILASFGLSNEDLEVLSHYPDDQLTPDTLPFILRDIQINKSSHSVVSTSASSFSRSLHDVPSSSSSLLASQEVPSFLTITQTVGKVIDYGHASRAKDEGETFKREPLSSERSVKMYTAASVTTAAPKAGKPERLQARSDDSTKHGDRDYRRTGRNLRKNTEFQTKSGHQDRDYRQDGTRARPSSESRSQASSRRSLSSSSKTHGGSMKSPTPTMISDFSAVSPKVFPHTCSLCSTQCDQEQDWTEHVNTVSHTAACRDLRNRFPDWRPDSASRSRQHGSRALPDRRDHSPSSLSRSPSPSLPQGKPRGDSRVQRLQCRSDSFHRRPGPYYHTERRPHSEHHSGSHSPHRPSSRDHCLLKRDRPPPGGPPRSGSKRAHEDSSPSSHSSRPPLTKSTKAVTRPGTKTAPKAPPAKKKKKVGAPAPEDSEVARRLVYLTGIPNDASEQEVTDLVCSYGKINNVILMPSSEDGEEASGQKASVCMMKAEDAAALSTSTSLSIREQTITASRAQNIRTPEPGCTGSSESTTKEHHQNTEAERPSDETSRNPERNNTDAGNNSAEVNQTTSETCWVLVSGLPGGFSRSDILDLFPSVVCDVIMASHLRKALVSVTAGGAVQEMMKVHSVTPAKVKDTEVDLCVIQQNLSLGTPVALYNLLMTSAHVLDSPVRVGWSHLLVITNVPDIPSASKEVEQLVRRFGTVIKTLVLENMVICEMATAAMALSVYKRFQTFPCIVHRNPLIFSRKPDLKAPAKVVGVGRPEAPENTSAGGTQTANEEEALPVPTGPCRENETTAAMSEDQASGQGSNRDGHQEAVCDGETLPGQTPAGHAVTEATGVGGESEAAHQEVPVEPEATADDTTAPQGAPEPPIPKMTQAMVNALLEECRIQTAKNTAAPPSGHHQRSPTAAARNKAGEEKQSVKEVKKKEERKVKEMRQKQWVKEKSEKEERARRMKERSEKAWRERERKRGHHDLPRSRSSSRSEGHRRMEQPSKMEDGTKMEQEEEEEEEFPFNMSDFVTVDEVGDVTDLPSVAMDTCDAHTHPEGSSSQDQASPAEVSQSPASGPAAGSPQHESTPVQDQVPTCPAEAPERSEDPEAPEESELQEGSGEPGGLEAPADPEAPEAHPTPEPGSAPSTPAAPPKSSGITAADEEKGEEDKREEEKGEEEKGEEEKGEAQSSADHNKVKDGAAGEEKPQRSEELEETNQVLPPFDPSRPVGLEFLVPKTGFFCKVCRRFFSGAKEAELSHCRTIKHYENLQKYLSSSGLADEASKMASKVASKMASS